MSIAGSTRPQTLTGAQLRQLLDQLQRRAGITIDSSSQVIAEHVHARVDALGLGSVEAYLAMFDDSFNARAEWLALVDLLTVKETRFFRQVDAFSCVGDYLKELLEANFALQQLAFWSVGCSTGQECYSLAMVVEDMLRRYERWYDWHGIGTDISFDAINTAQTGGYQGLTLANIPAHYRDSYLERTDNWTYQVSSELRARTHFVHSNLLHADGVPFTDFDIVFCQNVLIYFERAKQHWIIDQLTARLKPGGLLVLGAGEAHHWSHAQMQRLDRPGVCAYKKLEIANA